MVSPVKNSGALARLIAARKRGAVVKWLLRWHITDRHVLTQLLGLARSGAYATIKKMIDAGMIAETRINGCPVPVLHLREPGLMAAQRLLVDSPDGTMTAPIYASRLNTAHVQHDLLVQRFVLDFSSKNPGASILSEQQILARGILIGRDKQLSSPKVPDAIVIVGESGARQKWALEIQETTEDRNTAERKMSQYAEAISRNEIYGLIYASTMPAIVSRLERIASGDVNRWWYNADHKRWYVDAHRKDDPITQDFLQNRFIFLSRPDLSSHYYQYPVR